MQPFLCVHRIQIAGFLMGRHRQPDALAEIKGATRANPQRYRNETPRCEIPFGDPPAHLTRDAKKAWQEIEAGCIPGVLAGADRVLVETAAILLAQMRKSPDDFPAAKLGHLIGALARLGMTPTDRTRLQVPKAPEDANPFARNGRRPPREG